MKLKEIHALMINSVHMKNIHPEHTFICCKKLFDTSLEYDLHQGKKHFVKNDQGIRLCPKCKGPFGKTMESLIKHIRIDHYNCPPIKCDQCHKDFESELKMKIHVKLRHTTELNFQCDKCEKRYKNRGALATHIAKKHSSKTTFHCDKCEFSSVSKLQFDTHYTRMHSTGEFICDECGKSYTNPLSLRDHKREVHRNSQEIMCIVEGCGRIFCNKQSMMRHFRRNHRGDAKYKCQYCEKMFNCPAEQLAHEKHKHLGINDVACQLCSHKTASYALLNVHIRRVHGEEKFYCDYEGCNKGFSVRENMYAHKRRVHRLNLTASDSIEDHFSPPPQ